MNTDKFDFLEFPVLSQQEKELITALPQRYIDEEYAEIEIAFSQINTQFGWTKEQFIQILNGLFLKQYSIISEVGTIRSSIVRSYILIAS